MIGAPAQRRAGHTDLQANIVEFCRLLRERDLLVTPAEVIDALRTAELIDLVDRTELKLALRSVLTARQEDLAVYDTSFEEFWRARLTEGGDDHFSSREREARGAGLEQTRDVTDQAANDAEEEQRDGADAPRYSPVEVLARRNFGSFSPDQLEEISRALLLIARRLALQQSRRYRAARRGQSIDLRRTFRRNIKYGGTILEIARKRRKLRKPRIVLLCDVSRSMETYSTFLLQFIYALQHTLGRVESFVFSTRLTRVTEYFRAGDIFTALDRISREVPDWSGGTRIGDSLHSFNKDWAPRVIERHTIVVVLSDGLDSGDAGVLAAEMAELDRRAARVIWLNPLLGDDSYRPVARTMRAALGHVSLFASAHNLESLELFGRELTL
ncbi:MAG TPA: VWA domain-containing protein [Chloroflexota bacterium]|nr:VWA domain-containing protein [Chloroflexota bacterium]